MQTETTQTTNSDHFTVLGETLLLTNEPKYEPSFRKTRDLRGSKGDKALNVLSLLDLEIKQSYSGNTVEVDKIAASLNEFIDQFAPESIIANEKNEKN